MIFKNNTNLIASLGSIVALSGLYFVLSTCPHLGKTHSTISKIYPEPIVERLNEPGMEYFTPEERRKELRRVEEDLENLELMVGIFNDFLITFGSGSSTASTPSLDK